MSARIIEGSHGWFFHAVVDGDDLVVRGVIGTWFGGDFDPDDDGTTASGVMTKGNPKVMGCALPVPDRGKCAATKGTPLPEIPWGTMVEVTSFDGLKVTVPLIDVGPAESTYHGVDLTVEAFQEIGGTITGGKLSCNYRIIGGAKFL